MKNHKQAELSKIRSLVLKADYKNAKLRAENLRKKMIGDFQVDFTYAKILGDYADELPSSKRLELKKAASKILGQLIYRMRGQSEDIRFGVRINFYYQAKKFSGLEKVGKELLAKNKLKGFYAAGAGSSLEAERLFRKSRANQSSAKQTAIRSLNYWSKYFSIQKRETYYFPYTLLAMSEAILGNHERMEKALIKAQELSGKNRDFWEFQEIRDLFNESIQRGA